MKIYQDGKLMYDGLQQHKEEENPIEELCEKIGEWYNRQQEQMLIDDIIESYEGGFVDYEIYVLYRTPKVSKDYQGLEINIQPFVMSKEVFEYIRIKGKRAKKC